MIPTNWTTQRTRIDNVRIEEAELLTSLFNANVDVAELDPTFNAVDVDEVRQLIEESVRDESAERGFRMQAIRLKTDDAPIGYFHFRESTPAPDVVGMTIFFLRPEFRSGGYGREVVDALIEHLASDPTNRRVWSRVYLKNIPALRFWTSRGFTSIVEYKGEHVHREDEHASVILERTLP